MKKLLPFFLVFFVLVNTIELNAQNTNTYRKKWLFGMNWGGAWENADVHSRLGTGWGLTLEREVVANNTSLLGFSLRGRYLHTWMWGRDLQPFYGITNDPNLNGTNNPSINYLADGYVYRNFYTKTNEFSLEGLLILNRLRAHSGFKIYGFGGIGATGYMAKINQLDGANNIYDYSSVSTFSPALTRNDLNKLWDNTYETNANGSKSSYVMSGAIGIGIGIKLSPNVYLGWEHKYTYTSTDMLDASRWTNNNTKSLKNDRYHYTSLFVTVALGAGTAPRTPVQNQTTYYPPPAQLPKPIITQLYPHENPAYIPDCNPEIKLGITNIASVNQLTVLKDGNVLSNSYYSYDQVSEVLTIRTPINGNTVFSIIAENATGRDTKYVYTNCTPAGTYTPPAPVYPVITIVSSNGNNCIANVVATVQNVPDVNSIQVIMDGIILSSAQYTFNVYNGTLIIDAPFNQFTTITIRAMNNGNSVVQSASLSCNRPSPVIVPPTQQMPIINITNSQVDKSGGACVARINATVSGIMSANNIQITQNGMLVGPSNYMFDPATGILSFSNSIAGSNTFLIKAQNIAGTATSTVQLDCTNQPQVILPAVVLIHPATNTYTSNSCNENFAVKVTNVPGVQNIDVRINGLSMNKTLLHFDPATSILRFDAQFTSSTTVVVYASNNTGSASQTLIINCKPVAIPTIQITSPAADPFVSITCKETVTAIVTDVPDKSSIQVTLNGVLLTTGIIYDPATDKLTVPVTLSGRSQLQINALGKGGSASKSITLICQPAPKPVITIVSPATNPFVSGTCQEQVTAQIQNVASVTNISATINGIPVANNVMNYDATTGILGFPVQFTGIASVVIKATNAMGISMQTLSLECKPTVLPKPGIQLITPVTINSISKTCLEAVKLRLSNCASLANVSVLINNQALSADKITYNTNTGIIDFQVPVVGTTTIVVSTTNNGGVATKTITIQCQPTVHPSVSILQPIGSPFVSTTCNETIKAVVTNVSDINQIDVTFNAVAVDRTTLSYDTSSNVLSFKEVFTGSGDLIIKASNEAGSDSKTITLQCQPLSKPEIIIINPTAEPWASPTCRDTIIFVAKNIESVDGITALTNNVAIPRENITFDHESGMVYVRTDFDSDREIKLTATNAAGSATKTIHLTCAPVLQPTITLTNPVSDKYTSTTCQENVLMTLTNIASINQIQVQNNGVVVNQSMYTYNAATGLLTIPTAITTATTLQVIATNKTKTASKTITITCNKLPLPVVSITSPVTQTAVLTNCRTTIKATVDNIASSDQLVVLVNGKVLPSSSYTFIGNTVSFPVSVTDQSTVLLTATNTTGATSDNVTLICNVSQVVTGPTGNTCSATPASPITNCTICNDTIDVSGGDITVDANKKVCIVNSFNGNVNMNGGQLVICGNATIHNINFNSGDIVITGSASFDNMNMNNSASAVRNYGTVQFSNITFNGRFENHGQATVRSDFNVNSGAVFINTGTMNATMSFNNNNFVCNSGTIVVGGNLKDNGSAEFINSCKVVVTGQINIDHYFTNNGSVSAGSITYINGSSRLTLGDNSKWITDGLIVNGTITGPSQNCSSISITNQTTLNSSASLSGKIDICDLNGIELKSGSIASTVTDNCSCTINMSGNCGLNDDLNDQITICHNPTGSTAAPQTLTISRSALSAHIAHGDHIGACTAADKPVVEQNPTPIVPPVVVPVVPPATGTQTQPVPEETITICHKPNGNSNNVQTLTIPKSALTTHLAHGDHIGPCTEADKPQVNTPVVVPPATGTQTQPTTTEEQITICHKPNGHSGNVQTLTISRSELSAHLAHGDHVGACTESDNPQINTPVVVPPTTGTQTQPTGGTQAQPVPEEQITICHKPNGNSNNVQTLTIPKSALTNHLAHGDHIGPCVDADKPQVNTPVVVPPTTGTQTQPTTEEQITICHKPNGHAGNVQTLTISKSELSAHLAHGDHVGACTESDNPQVNTPVVVPPTTGTQTQPTGTQTQPVPEETITICHKPNGNSNNVQTLTIPKSALSSHLAHGDHVGACTEADKPQVNTPVVVPPSTQQPVPEEQITICHKPNGHAGNVQTITIPKSDLSSHMAHGDHVGACTDADKVVAPVPNQNPNQNQHQNQNQTQPQTPTPNQNQTQTPVQNMVTICHKQPNGQMQTITIPQSDVQNHMAHGDHMGVCRPDEIVK
jgi:hypothetical protein